MSQLPVPVQGLVVTFNYLWAADSAKGETEARKGRPCIIVAVADPPKQTLGVAKIIGVIPITHTQPLVDEMSLQVADRHKQSMGLDDKPCWVICGEMNTSIWPGYDLLRTSNASDGWTRGRVPTSFLDQIIIKMRTALENILFGNTNRR